MAHRNNDNLLARLMEMINENGIEAVAETFQMLLNEAMKIERSQALGAGRYERTEARRGYANGYKPRTVDTRMGRLSVDVPQVRGDVDFYPSALERGCRSERALKLAIAEMYVKGVSTRRVTDVLEKMCGLNAILAAAGYNMRKLLAAFLYALRKLAYFFQTRLPKTLRAFPKSCLIPTD